MAKEFDIKDGVLKRYNGKEKNLTIPDGVTSIGKNALKDCDSLECVTIPESVMNISAFAFLGCINLKSVNIPNRITKIGTYAFCYCNSLESVTIPKSVAIISDFAFEGCSSLASVIISDGVASIGNSSFYGCKSLVSMTIPEGVTRIGDEAFGNCSNLKSVTIPESVTCIGDGAFNGTAIYKENSLWEKGVLYIDDFLIKAKTSLKGVYEVKDKTRCISDGAFQVCNSLTDVIIPESVTRIGAKAFAGCSNLRSVTIPNSVTSIGNGAFNGTAIYKENSLWEKDVLYIDDFLIEAKTSLKGVYEVKDKTRCIGDGAFQGCNSLTCVIISEDVTSIGDNAFYECNKISIMAPHYSLEKLRKLGYESAAVSGFINNYAKYTNIDIVAEYIKNISSQRKKYLPEILEKDLVDIIKMLYEDKKITMKNLEQDYLHPALQCKSEKCIEFLSGLFGNNTDNKEISKEKKDEPAKVIPGQELWDNIHFSFDGKKLLKYKDEPGRTVYDVPEGTREICSEAFYSSKVQEVRIPESVIAIRKDAFYRYKPLFVKLPTGLKKLPKKAFRGAEHYVSTSNAELVSAICFDNSAYPIYMGELDNLNPKEKSYAVIGFLYALRTGLEDMSPWRASYIDHIRRNENTYIKKAQEDEFLISLMIDEKLISYKNVDVLLDSLGKRKNAELIARLLEYKSLLPEKEKKDEFSISNDTPEVKRKIKMAERAEQIKDQKGIQGIAFVSSGRLDNFGWYDYYTGASDMSDLKKYIEERGGFYRSAVSSKTDYLICNDPHSNTTKSKKAAELGVKVITEEEFLKMTNYDGEK